MTSRPGGTALRISPKTALAPRTSPASAAALSWSIRGSQGRRLALRWPPGSPADDGGGREGGCGGAEEEDDDAVDNIARCPEGAPLPTKGLPKSPLPLSERARGRHLVSAPAAGRCHIIIELADCSSGAGRMGRLET
mmetsp:Transcript_184343/g.584656  ORF Transcript_184343/g.584656 Transcript_184343/m.584656 type:complete len:137 (+) Transcript_184343:1577-1987(+)